MAMKVSAPDGVKVYNVSTSKNLPHWLSNSRKRGIRKDEEFRRRVELLQDLNFPSACSNIKASPDGEYVLATGLHPPQIRCYDLSQLGMKWSRHLVSEIVDFQILSDDWTKLAIICQDRSVALHSRFGAHYRVRIPRVGRDLAYFPHTAELVVAASAPELYRISLSEGRFMAPLPCSSPAINAIGISPSHGLMAAAGEEGLLECFDLRSKSSVGVLDVGEHVEGSNLTGLTAVRFDQTGLQVAVGTKKGTVAIYDLRSNKPIITKDHMYGTPIVDIKFHHSGLQGGGKDYVISADRRIVKVWELTTGRQYTSIEPQDGDINDICLFDKSGLILVGCDAKRVESYFIPSLGPAPRWCSFLENLTEELEESEAPQVYDDYRFVTAADLEKLGLRHLLGTSLLRSYMHGYFIDNRLYHKAKNITDPFAYATYRAKRIEEKMESERKSRITVRARLPKVNALAAARFMQADEDTTGKAAKKAMPNPMVDDRFKAMFEDKAFEIDEKSEEYRLLHPNADSNKRESKLLREHFKELQDNDKGEEEEEEQFSDPEGIDSGDDEEERGGKKRPLPAKRSKREGGGGREPRMFAAKDEASAAAFKRKETLSGSAEVPLSQRVAAMASKAPGEAVRRPGGSKEVTFSVGRGSRGRGGGREGARQGGRERGRGGGRGGRRGGGRRGGRR